MNHQYVRMQSNKHLSITCVSSLFIIYRHCFHLNNINNKTFSPFPTIMTKWTISWVLNCSPCILIWCLISDGFATWKMKIALPDHSVKIWRGNRNGLSRNEHYMNNIEDAIKFFCIIVIAYSWNIYEYGLLNYSHYFRWYREHKTNVTVNVQYSMINFVCLQSQSFGMF